LSTTSWTNPFFGKKNFCDEPPWRAGLALVGTEYRFITSILPLPRRSNLGNGFYIEWVLPEPP